MRFEEFKKKLERMEFKEGSVKDKIKSLIIAKELLVEPATSDDVCRILYEIAGKKVASSNIPQYMLPFMEAEVVRRKRLNDKVLWYGSWQSNVLGKRNTGFQSIEALAKTLGKNFESEMEDLAYVYGHSGTCTAFMLRKILEKATFLSLARHGLKENELKDFSGKYLGLEALLNLASQTKVKGLPILQPQTLKKVQGVKFLGDASAHNYLVNVSMDDIVPQLPFIVIAMKEISKSLS